MLFCLIIKKAKFDDVMENFAVYGSAGFWSMLASVFFLPYQGILWSNKESGNILGVQLLGWVCTIVWVAIVSWIYFFAFKRCKLLRISKADEVLGQDVIDAAISKDLSLVQLKEKITSLYPESKKKGC